MKKNILVIGGSSGIGKHLCEVLEDDSSQLFATYHNHETKSVRSGLEYYNMNVLDDQLVFDFIPDELDGVVYCPGSINLQPFSRIRPADFLEDFSLQVVGAIKVIQGVLPQLKKSGNASIVLFSSVAAQQGLSYHTQVATSKGAIEGLCRNLAAELAPAIRVNCIAPSLIDTPLAARLLRTDEKRKANAVRHPLNRIGQVGDIAEMAAYLLSDRASWITGQIFKVDGGFSAIKS